MTTRETHHGRPQQDDGRVHGAIVGFQRDDGCWLLIRRSQRVAAPGQICFPGGAIEVGEAMEDAARREAREEVGADVRLIQQVWQFELPERPLTLLGWHAELVTRPGDLRADPREVAELLWLTRDQALNHPDVMKYTDQFLDALPGVEPRTA